MGCEIEKTIWSHAYITSPGLHHLTLRFNYGAPLVIVGQQLLC